MTKFNKRFWAFAEGALPWVVLIFIGYITFAHFFIHPYMGFGLDQNITIGSVISQIKAEKTIQTGDTIQRLGSVTPEMVANNLQTNYYEGLKAGNQIEIVVERSGQVKTFQYTIPGVTAEEVFFRLDSQWFIPYVFWLAGTAALFFLRPRSAQRLLLALFCYLTAGWLASSNLSGYNLLNGALLLRSLIWLSLPVYLHLHWVFPTPLRRLPGWAWGLLYGLSAVMAVVSWLQLVPPSTYFIGFITALLGSLVLLVVHLVAQPSERRPLLGLAVALGMVLMPVIAIAILGLLKIYYPFPGIVVLGVAALPGFYFFTLYRRQLSEVINRQANRLVLIYVVVIFTGLLFCVAFALTAQTPVIFKYFDNLNLAAALILVVIALVNFLPFLVLPALAREEITLGIGSGLRFSANRAASAVFFILIEALIVLLLSTLFQQLHFPGVSELSLVLAVLLMGSGALLFYQPFKRFFERRVLGISLQPEALARIYAGRITTSLERSALQKLLADEVMPSLLVRQFAQVILRDGKLQLDFGLRVNADMLPGGLRPGRLDALCGTLLDADNSPLPAWMRLVLPLQSGGETRGYWLLGQRDPDDRYSEEDIATLRALADQTALALVNIDQADNLRALYFADIDRNEVERLHLGAELHDDVLGQMSLLSQSIESSNLKAVSAYEQSVLRIREIINGLRPAMLNFGLRPALETLVDELNERLPQGPKLELDLPEALIRYDSRVELYLFRVVQQACSNAVQHAACQHIRITGSLSETAVEVLVSDDGKGFAAAQGIDLPALLAGKHFGLAGMYERAALIGAEFNIQSRPGEGTRVSLNWSTFPSAAAGS